MDSRNRRRWLSAAVVLCPAPIDARVRTHRDGLYQIFLILFESNYWSAAEAPKIDIRAHKITGGEMDIVFQKVLAEALRYSYAALWLSIMRTVRNFELKRRRRLARRPHASDVSPLRMLQSS